MSEGSRLRARRLAVKFDPPCLILEYIRVDGGGAESGARPRQRVVRLSKSDVAKARGCEDYDEGCRALAAKVAKAFPRAMKAVRILQLERLVRSLCDGCAAESGGRGQNKANKGGDDGDGGRTGEKGEAKGAGPVDLNRVSEAELEAAKASMDVGFEATRIRPGDERWQYDVQVDFAPGDGPNDWDDSESD